jgi:hypothetical protein
MFWCLAQVFRRRDEILICLMLQLLGEISASPCPLIMSSRRGSYVAVKTASHVQSMRPCNQGVSGAVFRIASITNQ